MHWTLCRGTTALALEPPVTSLGLYELPVFAARTLAGEALSSGPVLAVVCDGRCLEEDQALGSRAATSRIGLVEVSQRV